MTILAVAAAAIAAALCLPWRAGLPGPDAVRRVSWWPALPVGFTGCVVLLDGQALALGLIIGAAAVGYSGLVARGRSRTAADSTRVRVLEACEVMASELRAGQPPVSAVGRGAEVWPELAPVLAAAHLDADVPQALRRIGVSPGAEALVEVASAWQVSQCVGAGLAHALDRVVDNARGRLATHRVISGELASAQATARMVAVLPVVLLVLSDGSGSDPWHFLLQSTPGLACLGGGLALALAGMWWIDRIVSRVHRGDL